MHLLIAFAAVFRALLAVRFNFSSLMAAVELHRNRGGYEPYPSEKSPQRPWRATDAILTGIMDVVLAVVGYLL
jgi:hypothetical protein